MGFNRALKTQITSRRSVNNLQEIVLQSRLVNLCTELLLKKCEIPYDTFPINQNFHLAQLHNLGFFFCYEVSFISYCAAI